MTTRHFIERVRERVGPHVDPYEMGDGLIEAIQEGRNDLVEFVGRIHRTGLRCFRFQVPDGRFFYALVDTERWRAVTVLHPGHKIRRERKGDIYLKEADE